MKKAITKNHWSKPEYLPLKEEHITYAYMIEGSNRVHECSREGLIWELENKEELSYITRPDLDTFIISGTDYESLQPILRRKKRNLKNSLGWGLAVVIIGVLIYYFTHDNNYGWQVSAGSYFFVTYGLLPVLTSSYELFKISNISPENFMHEVDHIKFSYWLNFKEVRAPLVLAVILCLITLFQFITGINESVLSAGLVKDKVWDGEYWRLLTCTLLHGSIVHIVFNAGALFSLGNMVIKLSGYFYFMLVFLVYCL